MNRARAFRTLLAAVLVLAQSAAGSFAAQMAAGAPCAVHAALASSGHEHASDHHDHGSTEATEHAHHDQHEQSEGSGGDAEPHFSLACCSACTAGLTAADIPLRTPGWHRGPVVSAIEGLEPGELPSTDPPPRILL